MGTGDKVEELQALVLSKERLAFALSALDEARACVSDIRSTQLQNIATSADQCRLCIDDAISALQEAT